MSGPYAGYGAPQPPPKTGRGNVVLAVVLVTVIVVGVAAVVAVLFLRGAGSSNEAGGSGSSDESSSSTSATSTTTEPEPEEIPTDARVSAYCDVVLDVNTELNAQSDAGESWDTEDAIEMLSEVGTPEEFTAEEREGFELYLEILENVHNTRPLQYDANSGYDEFSASEQAAFDRYVDKEEELCL